MRAGCRGRGREGVLVQARYERERVEENRPSGFVEAKGARRIQTKTGMGRHVAEQSGQEKNAAVAIGRGRGSASKAGGGEDTYSSGSVWAKQQQSKSRSGSMGVCCRGRGVVVGVAVA